jgi:predicted metal-dependent HD superfamily phosphohydrolase
VGRFGQRPVLRRNLSGDGGGFLPMTESDALLDRWRVAWRAKVADDSDAIFHDLVARYAEPHRAYHNLEHIAECLSHLDTARQLAERPAEVELAIWFHDAVYDPRRSDNEELSARLAEQELLASGTGEAVVARIVAMILATTHASAHSDGDTSLLVDIDLTILGATPERFSRYDMAIRREYKWVPEAVYKRERARVLAGFLVRPRIYRTVFFNQLLENQARANITAALQWY